MIRFLFDILDGELVGSAANVRRELVGRAVIERICEQVRAFAEAKTCRCGHLINDVRVDTVSIAAGRWRCTSRRDMVNHIEPATRCQNTVDFCE